MATILDIVYLKSLSCPSKIGVWEWEQKVTQTLTIDLELAVDASAPAKDDDLSLALNYQAVALHVTQFAEDNHFQLIETFAERLAQELLSTFDTPWVRLTVDKGRAVKSVKHVGITIERGSK